MALYLLERIAEDERVAWEATSESPGPWVQGDHDVPGWDRDLVYYYSDGRRWTQFDDESMAAHVARHDPARVLTECGAKRQVAWHCLEVLALGDGGAIDLAEEVLQRLVQVHADRPDFPPEWLPEVPW